MAKDKSGFMQENIGGVNDPSAPNYGLLEQAGAARGRAAEIAGVASAESVKFLGTAAVDAYKGYKLADLEAQIRDITDRTVNVETGWLGSKAADTVATKKALEKQEEAVWASLSEENSTASAAELKTLQDKLAAINSARDSEVLTPEAARHRIGAALRASIASLPGMADEFRREAQRMTGVGGLDVAEVAAGLALGEQKKASTVGGMPEWLYKQQIQAAEKEGYQPAIAHQLLTSPETQATFIAQLNAKSMQRAGVEEMQKLRAGAEAGSKIEFEKVQKAIGLTLGGVAMEQANALTTFFTTQRISLNDIVDGQGMLRSNAPQEKVALVKKAMSEAMSTIGMSYERAINNLDIMAGQGVLPSDVQAYKKTLSEERDRVLKGFSEQKDLESGVALLKVLRVNEGEAFDTAMKRLTVFSKLKEISGGDVVWAAALDPRTAEAFAQQNPELYKRIKGVVSGSFEHANHLMGVAAVVGAARTGDGAAVANVSPEAKKEGAKLNVSSTLSALKNVESAKNDVQKVNQVVSTLGIVPLSGEGLNDVHAAVVTGKLDQLVGEQANTAYEQLKANISRWVNSSSPLSYKQQLAEQLASINDRNTVKTRGGKVGVEWVDGRATIVYKDAKGQPARQYDVLGLYGDATALSQVVDGVNKLKDMSLYMTKKGVEWDVEGLFKSALPTRTTSGRITTQPAKSTNDPISILEGELAEQKRELTQLTAAEDVSRTKQNITLIEEELKRWRKRGQK